MNKMTNVLEHLGEMGRKEIARTHAACLKHLLAAGGAGVVTVGTVALKITILGSGLATGILTGLKVLNFVVSFLLIQAAGFRLATKQSTLFGAAFSARWQSMRRRALAMGGHVIPAGISARISARLREDMSWIARTQAMSALGNLLFVVVGGALFHWGYSFATGSAFLTEKAAESALSSLHPWQSATLVYAALTGVLLWLSSVCGGAIAERLKPRSKAVASAFFNIILGVLLAMVPMLGHHWSIPVDVRHFTLSGGTVAIATASLGMGKALAAGLLPAILGVAFIGAMNFGVSFLLAFLSGLAARPQEEIS